MLVLVTIALAAGEENACGELYSTRNYCACSQFGRLRRRIALWSQSNSHSDAFALHHLVMLGHHDLVFDEGWAVSRTLVYSGACEVGRSCYSGSGRDMGNHSIFSEVSHERGYGSIGEYLAMGSGAAGGGFILGCAGCGYWRRNGGILAAAYGYLNCCVFRFLHYDWAKNGQTGRKTALAAQIVPASGISAGDDGHYEATDRIK